jgi:CRISPR/Cas system-associated exonuclease Cas4 (RecB family)
MGSLPENFRFSQSSLQDYDDCPRRFRLRYLEGIEYPAMQAEPALENERLQWEGSYFHRLAQQYLLGVSAEKIERLANTPNIRIWWQNFLSFARADLADLRLCLPEVSLSAPLGRYRLVAKYDLLALTSDGRLIIYDWKTSRRRPKNEWLASRWQTRVYRFLAVRAAAHLNAGKPFEAEQIEMVYWMANAPDEPARFPYSPAQARRDADVLQARVAEIAGAVDFPPTEDERLCSFCTYRSYCDRGRLAGNLDDLDGEYEADEAMFDLNFEQIAEIAF